MYLIKMSFPEILKKMKFESNKDKVVSQEEVIDIIFIFIIEDINSETKWKGFYHSLSKIKLIAHCMTIGLMNSIN